MRKLQQKDTPDHDINRRLNLVANFIRQTAITGAVNN